MSPTQRIADRFIISDPEQDLLGRGSMGDVYRATDTHTGELVAVKALDPSVGARDPGILERFAREGEALRQLDHPNIVRMIAALEDEGRHYLVMEYIAGGSLQDLLEDQGPLPVSRVLEIALELADALTRAHHLGIIHRDLKPANVLLTADGTPRLTDFGIARVLESPRLTQTGVLVGTPDFLSPEACRGQVLDERTDIWAFGVLLFEMLSGGTPFGGDSLTAKLTAILTQPVPDLGQLCPEAPEALVDLVYRMLEKDRQQRIPSVRLVGAELEAILKGREIPTPPHERPASAAEVLRTLGQSLAPAARPLHVSPPRPTNNLPAQLSQFIGREKELVKIKQCLAEHRLVTLTGSGGIGKTRMAIQAARELLAEVPQGVWLAELAPVADPRLVPQAVAAVWDVREEQGRPLQVTLADYLREKTLLLVLDNCEHVIDASSQLVGTLLQRCPGLGILATSREVLGVEGEFVVRVPSLSLPPTGPASRATLQGSEAVRLFVSRAVTALPGFELTDANVAAVAQVCHRLDGVALALELAAARVRALRVEQIAARLDDAFHLLTGGSRTVLPHQQTLRATMDWSHALLSDAERACFRRLAVFAGDWTLEAAEAVCAGEGVQTADVLDLLAQLGNKSLVVIDREQGQVARHRLLETIRQYAWEKLQEAGEQEQSRTQHLEYYCRLTQEVEPKLYGAQQLEGLAQLDAEQGNIRAALEWGLENRLEAGAQLAGAMFWYWHVRGLWADGFACLQRALAVTSGGSKALRALLLSRAGHLAQELRDTDRGVRYCEESIALCRELGDEEGAAYALAELGIHVFFDQADRERGRTLWQESLDLYQQAGNKWGCRHVLGALGLAYAMEQPDYSLACWQESLALARELGVPDGIAWALYGLGVHAFLRGDDERAMALFAEGLPLSHAIRQPYLILESLFCMEVVALRQGEFEQAKALAREALEEGIRGTGLRVSWRLGLQFAGSPWRSEALLFENLARARESDDKLVIAHGLFSLAALAWSLGQLENAVRLYAAALGTSGFAPSLPLERTDFDHTLTGTLVQLDETAFQKAWAEGSAMTVEQAVAYALEGRP